MLSAALLFKPQSTLYAQTVQLSSWDFNASNTTPTLATGVAASSISAGGALQTSTSFPNSFRVSRMTATTASEALNGFGTTAAQYIAITLTPASQYAIDITSISFQAANQGRARTYDLRYINSQTGQAEPLGSQEIAVGSGTYTFPISGLTGKTATVELRLYIYSATVNQWEVSGFGDASGADFVVNGIAYNSAAQVLPGTWSLNGNIVSNTQYLGTNNAEALTLKTNGQARATLGAQGGIQLLEPTTVTTLTASRIGAGNIVLEGNTLSFTGPSLYIYTPTQAQWNGGKPLLSISQYGEIDFYARPYLNYNELYLQNKGSYRNAIGYSSTYQGVQIIGEQGGVLGTRAQNEAGSTVTPALTWKGQDVSIPGGSLDIQNDISIQGRKIPFALNYLLTVSGQDITLPATLYTRTITGRNNKLDINGHTSVIGDLDISGDLRLNGKSLSESISGSNLWKSGPGTEPVTYFELTDGIQSVHIGEYLGIVCAATGPYYNPDLCNACIQSNYNREVCGKIMRLNTNPKTVSVPDAKVGIGTLTPRSNLEVVGNAYISGVLTLAGLYSNTFGRVDLNSLARFANTNLQGIIRVTSTTGGIIGYTRTSRECFQPDKVETCYDVVTPTFAEQLVEIDNVNSHTIGRVHAADESSTFYETDWVSTPVQIGIYTYEGYLKRIIGRNIKRTILLADQMGVGTSIPGTKFHLAGGDALMEKNVTIGGIGIAMVGLQTYGLASVAGVRFADGSVLTTAGAVNTFSKVGSELVAKGNVNILGQLKLGVSSLYLGGSTAGIPGTSNFIYTDNGQLEIQSNTNNTENTVINKNGGRVLIGNVVNPISKLNVSGDIYSSGKISTDNDILASGLISTPNRVSIGTNVLTGTNTHKLLVFGTSYFHDNIQLGTNLLLKPNGVIDANSGLSINGDLRIINSKKLIVGSKAPIAPDADYKMAVEGKIVAQEMVVTAPTNWADFVFDASYKLKSLDEVEAYIQAHKHLKDVPSQAEVKQKGVNIAEMDAILLRKLEELTLYVIELKKEISNIKNSK